MTGPVDHRGSPLGSLMATLNRPLPTFAERDTPDGQEFPLVGEP